MGVQFEGNNSAKEVDVLCDGAVKRGSSNVRHMACDRCGNSSEDDAHRNAATQTRES